MTEIKIKNAFISLTDKSKIELVAKELKNKNINIISTGGTAKYLKSHSIDVIDITHVTEFPEILDGRVKSLHPKIFGGILFRRNNKNDIKTVKELSIKSIDLIIVNLYRFNETLKNSSSPFPFHKRKLKMQRPYKYLTDLLMHLYNLGD